MERPFLQISPSASDVQDTSLETTASTVEDNQQEVSHVDESRKEAERLLQTMNDFVYNIVHRSCSGVTRECFDLLEVICIGASNDHDPDLAAGCQSNLCWFASAILPRELIGDFLDAVDGILLNCPSWKAKTAILDVLQASVFCNMPTIRTKSVWVAKVTSIVVSSGLNADHVEVREKAGVVLAGLLHCNFIDNMKTKELIEMFQKMASAKKHSGIIGLCAFVSACPYR